MGIAAALRHYKTHHYDKYIESIADGVQLAIAEAEATVANCPATSLVMAGYSQGAMVMHQAELKLAAMGKVDTLNHIAGTLLLGDGDRVPKTRAKRFGTSSTGAQGIRAFFQPRGRRDVQAPENTADICNRDDIVCDFHLGLFRHPGHAGAVHTSYARKGRKGYSYSSLLTQAPKWLANRILSHLGAVIFEGAPDTDPPPAGLGPYVMTSFGTDPQDVGEVTEVSGPTGPLSFPTALDHELVGEGWLTWSNGYSGDVYVSDDSDTATVQLPAGTRAFYLYAEPNIFEDFNVSATTADGTTSGPVTVYGDSGAKYFGFYATGGRRLSEITVGADDEVAIGEFGISG